MLNILAHAVAPLQKFINYHKLSLKSGLIYIGNPSRNFYKDGVKKVRNSA